MGIVVIAALSLAVRFMSASPQIARAATVGRDLVAFDASGRDRWRYPLASADEELAPTVAKLVRWETHEPPQALVVPQTQRRAGSGSGSLMLLTDTGRLLWRRTLEARYTFGGTDYGPSWYPTDLLMYRNYEGEWRIAVAWHHHTWWPSVVTTFDRDGKKLEEFENAGWIHALNITPDGRYLLAAGVSNAFGGAVLAVLDANRLGGASPPEQSTLPACSNCPSGAPVKDFLVPWSDLARPADTPSIVVQTTDAGQVELRAAQRVPKDGPIPELIVTFSPALEVIARAAADSFVSAHGLLERQQQLNHSFDRCVWKRPAVCRWTAAEGWRDVN